MPVGTNAYNSLWQVRDDAWSSLEESTAQLALASSQQRPAEQLTETVSATLDLLGPIEQFWAVPGPQAYQHVRQLFAAGKYDRCAAVVARLNRALATDSYGGGQAWDAHADEDAYDHDPHLTEQAPADQRYFEVLVVEDMTEEQERALRAEAQQLAAETFGSRQTYFVTNGTSTANKVVVQALVQPGDIVLVGARAGPGVQPADPGLHAQPGHARGHGYRADLGYRVYLDKALEIAAATRPAPPSDPAAAEAGDAR